MAPRRKCAVCGSKQWHKDSSSGLVACSEGHVIQNYRNEQGETQDLGNYTMRKRTLKGGRKKGARQSRADPKLYHGERARFHYYQCLQLVLRKQIAALIALWDLPPEFEAVCRDTWALHLSLLPRPPPAEPYHHMREQKGHDSDAGGTKLSLDNPEESRSDDNDNDGDDPQSCSSSSEEEDPELAELLRENSEFSSSEEEKDRAAQKQGAQPSYRFVGTYDRPVNCIVVLVVACWTMRLPVMYRDFIDITESYELPYLDSLRLLPSDMTCHLTKHAVRALSPRFPPNTLYLHRLASRLAKLMYANYGVFTPELNASPVLWRVVQQCLGSTPTLYRLAKRLGHILSLPLTLHHSLSSTLHRVAPGDPGSHLYDNVPPELALVATAIVVLKLVYGLDGKPRLPRVVEDPASALPDARGYLSAVRRMSEADNRHNERRFSSRVPMSTGDMDLATVDEFLDFCERVLVKSQRDEADQQIVDNYFPLPAEDRSANLEALAPPSIAEGLSAPNINVGETDVLQPGESYTIYHSRDVLGNLPEEQALIITQSAKWVGVSDDYLCGVVERFERRLRRWHYKERRREKEEQESEGDRLFDGMED
ncbi:hypothetical protein DEU56DRAFT_765734 [Suillus clintonianus]|uniref:uncharacterized protein n=1 Tax=Suillus clintonianus TaxID=1904413 RepID=UPI001B87FFEA|nr:uncharacterized protein DEU56DRAFT_765734 [Suillus clintonianus]KAG2156140.1 hypothetical protein DEU56DRAFT_765734 [Suillus clintonianus]